MAENIKDTFYEVPRRPLNRLPESTDVVSPKFPDIPRGSVKDRVNFFEKLKPQDVDFVPTRRFTADSVFSSNKLNQRVDLDDPLVLPVARKAKEEAVADRDIEVVEKKNEAFAERVIEVTEKKLEATAVSVVEVEEKKPEPHAERIIEVTEWKPQVSAKRIVEVAEKKSQVGKPPIGTPIPRQYEIPPLVLHSFPAPASSSPPPATQELTFFEHSNVPDQAPEKAHQRHSSLGISASEPKGELLMSPTSRESDIDAICVNCLEYVNLKEIDDHSFMCSQVAYNPTSSQEEFSLKIKKLHRAINRRIKAAKGEKLMMLIRLREIAVEVTKNEHINLPRVSMELDDLAATSLSIEGGIGCSIFARRLSNLVSEKETEINLTELTAENLLVHYNEEAERQRKELLQWKAQSQVLEQMAQAQKGLDEVKSDIGSDIGSAISSGSRNSGASLPNEETDIADLEAANEALQQVSEEQLKKYFYSMCLKQKLLLPKTHPSQKILVSGLFQECRRQGVPVAQWDWFISANLVK